MVFKLRELFKRIPGALWLVRSIRWALEKLGLAVQRFLYPFLLRKLCRARRFREGSISTMTVFILRENILFLEEWIDHHLRMGVEHFFLYDNSSVEKRDVEIYEENVIPGKVNKHGRVYDQLVTEHEAQRLLDGVLTSHPGRITVVPWQKRDKDGFVRYFQREALLDFLKNVFGVYDYCLFIDMDEFLVSRRGLRLPDLVQRMQKERITSYYLKSRLFSSRFNYVGSPVLSIPMCLPNDLEDGGFKSLFRIAAVVRPNIHCTTTILGNQNLPNDDMIMYHYCHNSEVTLVEDKSALDYIHQ